MAGCMVAGDNVMENRLLVIIATLSILTTGGLALYNQTSQLSMFLNTLESQGYDKRIRPPSDSATQVYIQIGFLGMGPVSLLKMSVKTEVLLRLWWNDPRLAFDNATQFNFADDPSGIIWIPDVYIFNAIETDDHQALKKNIRTRVGPHGNVYISIRLSIEFSCPMDFRLFPMDTQFCSLNLESYAYLDSEVALRWIQTRQCIEFTRDVKLSGYTIDIDGNVTSFLDYGFSQKFTTLKALFRLKRQLQYHLYHSFIPSIMIVMLSFCTFWIPITAIPARVTLIVTNCLTSMLIFSDAGKSTPQVPYHTAMELFALVNMIVIFLVMIEYVVVLSYPKLIQKGNSICTGFPLKSQISIKSHTNKAFERSEWGKEVKKESLGMEHEIHPGVAGALLLADPHMFDRYSRLLFPSMYSIFITIYFAYYLYLARE